MNYFFISDWHFCHQNIIFYENRPFKSVTEMNHELIRRHNERVKKEDTVFFLGDLGFYASKNAEGRGEGMPVNPLYHLNQMNGHIIRVCGNHETRGNKTFTPVHSITLKMGGLLIQLVHRPEDANLLHDLILCGHVHNRWATKEDIGSDGIPKLFINCCVEQSNYYPRSFDEIKKIWDKWVKTHSKRKTILTNILRNKNAS